MGTSAPSGQRMPSAGGRPTEANHIIKLSMEVLLGCLQWMLPKLMLVLEHPGLSHVHEYMYVSVGFMYHPLCF